MNLGTYLLEDLCKYMCEKFVVPVFGLILRLKLLLKPPGFGPKDMRVNQTSYIIYILKAPNGVPLRCTAFGSQTRRIQMDSRTKSQISDPAHKLSKNK